MVRQGRVAPIAASGQGFAVDEPIRWLRLAKMLSVLMFAAGSLGAVWPGDMPLKTRQRLAFLVAGPGFGLTWIAGFLLVAFTGHRVMSTWVILSLVLSLGMLHGVLFAAGKEGRARPRGAIVTLLAWIAVVGLMVFRPA